MSLPSVIANSNKRPGTFTRVSFGVGQRASGANARYLLLFGNKTSGGSAVAAQEHDCFSEDESRVLHGARSEMFWMVKAAIAAYPELSMKCIVVAESAGTAATGTIVIGSGPASAGGSIGVSVQGEEIEVPFSAGDSATVIGQAVADAMVAKTDWPVTAANVTGTVTVTHAQKGPRSNFCAVRARLISGAGITVTPPATGYLTGGGTSDDPQAALDASLSTNRRYLVAPYSDATQLAKFRTHVQGEDEPEIGHRKRVIACSLDTLANTTTLATGLNEPRIHLPWLEKSDYPPSMLAAAFAARLAARESVKASYNFDDEILPGVKPQYLASSRPLPSQIVAALNNGITPLLSADDGTVRICRAITTKSRDASSNADYRVLDISKVAVPDEIADRWELACADRFKGMDASQDDPSGEPPPPGVVTPTLWKDLAYEVLSQAEDDRLLELGSVEENKDSILSELSEVAPGRFNGVLPTDVIEGAHQHCTDIRQIG
jgi:phage tail sheath gpL-like